MCNMSIPTINPLPPVLHIFGFSFCISPLSITNMLRIKCDINQQDLLNLNNFHLLEVVDRVSETQLQVGENSN